MGKSDLLFATPSFVGGVSLVLDLGSTSTDYNSSETVGEADFRAIRSDWYAVGEDISEATKVFASDQDKIDE